jgi:hypothetical protein
MVEELFPDAQQILDYFHLCENVHTYAKALFDMNASKYMPWAKRVCALLKTSQYKSVLQELEPNKDSKPNGCPVNLYGYISNNIGCIDYVEYERKGYFIGSGAIESGNKIILQDRLKRAGMRWNVTAAQAMLTLKTKAESNIWHQDVERPFILRCLSDSLSYQTSVCANNDGIIRSSAAKLRHSVGGWVFHMAYRKKVGRRAAMLTTYAFCEAAVTTNNT